MVYLLNTVIFHSYVKLPEGILNDFMSEVDTKFTETQKELG